MFYPAISQITTYQPEFYRGVYSRLTVPTPVEMVLLLGAQGMLLAIINDVLDFSKIEAGKLRLDQKPLSIAKLTLPLRTPGRLTRASSRLAALA